MPFWSSERMKLGDGGVDLAPKRYSRESVIERREWILASIYVLALVLINTYICRGLFRNPTAFMGSMHGFWLALAKRAPAGWLPSGWWPYWDCGIPFEATYAPLLPRLIAAWTALTGTSHVLALQTITGVIYCVGPLTLFLMAWLLTRSAGASFLAALLYSLTAPTQLIVPDQGFSLAKFWDARRLFLMTEWDDTPHAMALAILPLAVLFLALSLEKRRFRYYIPAVLLMALTAVASEFGAVEIAMATLCLLFVYRRQDHRQNIATAVLLGAWAYAVVAPYFSPSLLRAVGQAGENGREPGFSAGSVTAIALIALGWAFLWPYLQRWTKDWRLQFFALFAYLVGSVPLIAAYLHRQFLPQPGRYKFEMEFALALVLVFALRHPFRKLRLPLRVTIILLLLSLATEQIASHYKFARNVLKPSDDRQTIEYRTSAWVEGNLSGIRVMMPGTISQWADDFAPILQLGGASWSKAMNPIQQRGLEAVYNGGGTPENDARISLLWLKAYGAGAVVISGPDSQEYWKPFAHPEKFEGVLPLLWRAEDVSVYRVPQNTASLAHVVPIGAIVTHPPASPSDVTEIETYVSALGDPTLPAARMEWEGRNRIKIRAAIAPERAISIQVTYHPGWHAQVGNRPVPVRKDGLGLMWLRPECMGLCEVQLDYDGGWELRFCRYLSFMAMAALVVVPFSAIIRRTAAAKPHISHETTG